ARLKGIMSSSMNLGKVEIWETSLDRIVTLREGAKGVLRPLSLANQTRTSQRSCIVVRERQSSPGDRIGTSMRTSDGPSRHQVSGKILHPRSDRDRRACPELQGFVLQYVRDCDAGTGGDEPRLVKSLAFSKISLFSPQGDPRDGPPPFCSRARRTGSPHDACHQRQRLQLPGLWLEHDPDPADHLPAE